MIENLSLLEKINIYKSNIINTESFEYLINLKELALVECDFSSVSIEPIVNLNNLESLMLNKSIGISGPVRIYNGSINKRVIENLDKNNIKYVYKEKESTYIIIINDTHFKIKRTTKFKKIFDAYCAKYDIDINNISFYLNDIKLNDDDTLNSLEIEGEDEIEITTRTPKRTSSRTSPKRTSSPKTKRTSSPKTKRTSSPKTALNDGKYKKSLKRKTKISPKRNKKLKNNI